MKKFSFTAMALMMFATSHADATPRNNGLSGEISALAAIKLEESNFNTEEKRKDSPLNNAGEREPSATGGILGQLRFTFGDHQLFLGTSRDDIAVGDIAFEVGYSHFIGRRTSISFSYLPSLGKETWEDPFVVDQDRTVTDINSDAFRIKVKNVLESPVSVDLAYYTQKLDHEASGKGLFGESIQSLNRNGDGIYSKLTYSLPLGRYSILEPSFLYRKYSADGSSMSNSSYAIEVAYKQIFERNALSISSKYMLTSYDNENPLFGKVQENSTSSIFLAYEYNNVFNLNNLSANAITGLEISESNIKFYESSELVVGIGSSYKF